MNPRESNFNKLLNVFVYLLIVLFGGGGFLYWLTGRKRRKKLTEDALKHIEELEEREGSVSLESLSGAISLSLSRTHALVRDMEEQGLVQMKEEGLHLTENGSHRALQLIRAHRLWERYLADEARLSFKELHGEAERREHIMSSTFTDALEAHLGYPKKDPHGDPIPSAQGVLSKERACPLPQWIPGKPAEIVHIEDEPPPLFAEIAREGLKPGMVIEILKVDHEGIRISEGVREHLLSPLVAENIFVAKPSPRKRKRPSVPLSILSPGERGRVVELECQGLTRRRFLDLGMLPGTPIEVLRPSALGEPHAYRLRDTVIAIRPEQAQEILIEPLL